LPVACAYGADSGRTADRSGDLAVAAGLAHRDAPQFFPYPALERGGANVDRQVGVRSLTFQPRADQSYFCVALASMVSKYLRELLMGEFNRFWQEHVPGLRPTAGYPTDAARRWERPRL